MEAVHRTMGFNKPNIQRYEAISLSVDGLLTSNVKFMQMTSLRAIKAVSSLVTLIIVPLFVAEPDPLSAGRRVLVVGKHRCSRHCSVWISAQLKRSISDVLMGPEYIVLFFFI